MPHYFFRSIVRALMFCGLLSFMAIPLRAATPEVVDPIASPKAVRGGTLTTWGGSFPKALNMWLDYNSFSGQVSGLMFEPLLVLHSNKNEPVGILAESWTVSEDRKTFTFKINPKARWSDGKPVTAEDVQFYYDIMMNPKHLTSIFRVGLSRFERPKVVDLQTLQITAKTDHWMNFWEAGGMVALPKHVWKNSDFNQQKFDFPVVSGPYQIKDLKKNRSLLMEYRKDWWGNALPYSRHKYNFDFLMFRFMEDQKKVLEAFKKRDLDVYPIYTASIWIQQTQFDQVSKGWVVRQRIYNKEPKGFQGFALNLRRETFKDVRVRKALALLLNRQLMNEKLMYHEYFMLNSYYPDLYPKNQNPQAPVLNFDEKQARDLLDAAGWKVDSDGIRKKNGAPLKLVLMTSSPLPHLDIYVEDLKKVGIVASIEQLSQASIRKRLDQYDFDLYWTAWGAGRLRDPEGMWHSKTADEIASSNLSGVKDSVVDDLIQKQKTEMSLDKRNGILQKLDRRLNELMPYVLLWQLDNNRVLYWNQYGHPDMPFGKFGDSSEVITYWWEDAAQKKQLETAIKRKQSLPLQPEVIHYTE